MSSSETITQPSIDDLHEQAYDTLVEAYIDMINSDLGDNDFTLDEIKEAFAEATAWFENNN